MKPGRIVASKRYLLIFGAVGALIVFFLLLGPPELLARSETPVFCGSCHVMETEFEAWSHAGAHRRKSCVDCHLPNENMAHHYLWKSFDGMKDVLLFYSGMVSEPIKLTSHGAQVVQANCIRCHSSSVEFINHERNCWECHRRLMHRRSGAIATL